MALRWETIILLAFCIWQPLYAGRAEAVDSPKSDKTTIRFPSVIGAKTSSDKRDSHKLPTTISSPTITHKTNKQLTLQNKSTDISSKVGDSQKFPTTNSPATAHKTDKKLTLPNKSTGISSKALNITPSVPGGWSDWSSWTSCYQEISFNRIDQCFCSTRQCNNPAPQNEGTPCEGVNVKVTNCTIHGGWTDWSEWSACNPTCGNNATKTRQRSCTNPAPAFGGRLCVGQSVENTLCTTPCPVLTKVPGNWSDWSSWTSCNHEDSIKKTDQCFCSTRQCNNPVPQNGGTLCEGASVKVTNCTIHGGWAEWSEWSACFRTSGKSAVKTRQRSCTNPAPAFGGSPCVGQREETATCTPLCGKPTRSQYYPLSWKKPINNETVPEEAIVGGSDEFLSGPTYVARVFYNVWTIAKYIPVLKSVRWAFNGTEYLHNEYEVLCGKRAIWLPSDNWRNQPGAVPVDDFKKMYICKVHHDKSVVPGKVHIDGGDCQYAFGGKEHFKSTYEVLFYDSCVEFIYPVTD